MNADELEAIEKRAEKAAAWLDCHATDHSGRKGDVRAYVQHVPALVEEVRRLRPERIVDAGLLNRLPAGSIVRTQFGLVFEKHPHGGWGMSGASSYYVLDGEEYADVIFRGNRA